VNVANQSKSVGLTLERIPIIRKGGGEMGGRQTEHHSILEAAPSTVAKYVDKSSRATRNPLFLSPLDREAREGCTKNQSLNVLRGFSQPTIEDGLTTYREISQPVQNPKRALGWRGR